MSQVNHKSATGIAVIGFGKTGKAVLDFLLETLRGFAADQGGGTGGPAPSPYLSYLREAMSPSAGIRIYLYNDTPIEESTEKYRQKGVCFLIGAEQFQRLEAVRLIILSPGVDGRTPRFDALREKGVVIISEIELASAFIPAEIPIIAVTGTNGKSTTVSLIHHFLSSSGRRSFLSGNIGTPFISDVEVLRRHPDGVAVLEVSSFQLEEIVHFRPHIGLILNITPDHLDRYPNTDEYFKAKLNLVKNQQNSDYLVLNADDPVLQNQARHNPSSFGPVRRLWFSRGSAGIADIFAALVGEEIHLQVGDGGIGNGGSTVGKVEGISLRNNPLRGVHNLENILAAVTAVRLLGVSSRDIENNLRTFKGLPHRMESVGKIGEVEFINDSKATNVDAALKSIAGIPGPMVLILGGKDKGSDYTVLHDPIRERVERVLLLGKAGPIIRTQLANLEGLQGKLESVSDLAEAVARGCQILEKTGGVVLLAPGCASFDMFNNFEHRGDVFKQEVMELKKKWPLQH